MDTIREHYDKRLVELIDETASHDVQSKEFVEASKNIRLFVDVRPLLPAPEPTPTPDPVPTTVWEKVKCGATAVWDNETTRVLIKAGGAFAGVGLVVWSTIHKDHVMERQAIAQANQRNS